MPDAADGIEPLRQPMNIDLLDPMVHAFALQHDLRERFLHALQELVKGYESKSAPTFDLIEAAKKAIDLDEIAKWMDDGRPLPWLDIEIGSDAEALRIAVVKALGGIDSDG